MEDQPSPHCLVAIVFNTNELPHGCVHALTIQLVLQFTEARLVLASGPLDR
jgi:hypothetical protein